MSKAKPQADTVEIPIRGQDGEDLGFAIRLGPEPSEPEEDDESGVLALASRIAGWSTLKIDGEPYTYSKARAIALLVRFGWMAEQLRSGEPREPAASLPAIAPLAETSQTPDQETAA